MSEKEVSPQPIVDWLKNRAEKEMLVMQKNKLSALSSLFASEEKREKSLAEAQKSLGRLEMIHELIYKLCP